MHLLLMLALMGVGDTVAQAASAHAEGVARALVPVLRELRRSIVVEPGTLPPSPFTGRKSTLIAIRVGLRSLEASPEVLELIDRLLAWKKNQALASSDRVLIVEWVEHLRIKVQRKLAGTAKAGTCDDTCLIEHLTNPGSLFGATRREQREMRDDLLLEALIEVVDVAPSH